MDFKKAKVFCEVKWNVLSDELYGSMQFQSRFPIPSTFLALVFLNAHKITHQILFFDQLIHSN